MAAKYENLTPIISAALDVDTTGDKATFTIPFKCRVYRAECVVTSTDAGGGTIAFDKRPTAGSDTNRGTADIANIVITAADNQGKCFYDIAGRGTILDEGEQVVVECTADPGTGPAFYAILIVDYIPEVPANNAYMTETA